MTKDEDENIFVKSDHQKADPRLRAALFKLNEEKDEFEKFRLPDERPYQKTQYAYFIDSQIWFCGKDESLWMYDIEN